MSDNNAYILGTEWAELHRLGVQHQVWASEAREGWRLAEFGAGQTILDLGCGPGFCTQELAYIAGTSGKVIGIDKSQTYIDFLSGINDHHKLNMHLICSDFDHMNLESNSIDSIYIRWALAWIPNPDEILAKLFDALVPGGAIVVQEYYDWSTFQMEPSLENLQNGINSIYTAFKDQEGDIDIGREIPSKFFDVGLEVVSTRPMAKIVTPEQLEWQWPKTFLEIYMPKLIGTKYITKPQVDAAISELYELDSIAGASIFCPQMIEVIGIKP